MFKLPTDLPYSKRVVSLDKVLDINYWEENNADFLYLKIINHSQDCMTIPLEREKLFELKAHIEDVIELMGYAQEPK